GIAVGANAGLAMNQVGFNPTIKQWWHMGPQVGITARFTSELYFRTLCSLQVELNYARTGWREHILSADGDELPDTYSRDHDYLQLPILAHLAWGREGRGLAGFLLAGPQLGFLLGEKSRFGDTWTVGASGNPSRPNGMFAQYSMDADHRFDYGITAGAGLELQTAAGRFIVEGRYYYGLADIYKNSKKDVFGRSNNGTIYAKVTYLFDLKRGK
ncbi:MAG: PorT family protein, partial [Alloprevotella sp.]|nr:PorT family protein [Alloprevotella sp.]